MHRSLVIENARIVDGTGSPWYRGSLLVEDGRIAAAFRERRLSISASRRVDARDRVVAPGFVDAHSHSDRMPFEDPFLEPKLKQGVTTEVVGQDGFSMAPLPDDPSDAWLDHLSSFAGNVDADWSWNSLGEYLDALERARPALNVATLVGHGTLRYAVIGFDEREASDGEMERIGELAENSLSEGAVGLSTGLVYAPQRAADMDELLSLAGSLSSVNRPLVAHIRSEGRHLWDALDELVGIGADVDVPVHVSHVKVLGQDRWGEAERVLDVLRRARKDGIDATADVYPYTAGSTPLIALLPPWLPTGDADELRATLEREDARRRLEEELRSKNQPWENVIAEVGWENVVVSHVGSDENQDVCGHSLAALAEQQESDPVSAACDLLLAEDFDVATVEHGMAERDVRTFLDAEEVAIGTDGLYGERPHPRLYGTYPKILGEYVSREEVISMPRAIQKMSALPARVYGLPRKGVLAPGMDADIVVFEPDAVGTDADFSSPVRHPDGVVDVFVGGRAVLRAGELTGERPGRIIRATEPRRAKVDPSD